VVKEEPVLLGLQLDDEAWLDEVFDQAGSATAAAGGGGCFTGGSAAAAAAAVVGVPDRLAGRTGIKQRLSADAADVGPLAKGLRRGSLDQSMLYDAEGAGYDDWGADKDWCNQQQQQQWGVEEGRLEPTNPSQQQQQLEEGDTDAEGESDSLPSGDGLIESQTRQWLQDLAMLLPLQSPAASITLVDLRQQLPVPKALVRHHKGAVGFIRRAPGLRWTVGQAAVYIEPRFHQKLRTAAAAAGEGGGARGMSCGDSLSGLARQHSAAMSAAGTADEGPRSSNMGRSWAGSFPQQQQQWQQQLQMLPQALRDEVWPWLQQLAMILRNPIQGHSFAAVKREAPFSTALMDYYRGAKQTISSLPGVFWDESDNIVRMDPQMHGELRAAAAAAAAAAGGVGAGGQQWVGPMGLADLGIAQGFGLAVQQQQQSLLQPGALGSGSWCQGGQPPPPLLPLLQQVGLGGGGSADWGQTLQQRQQSRCWQQLQALPLPVRTEAVAWLQQLSQLLGEGHGPARGIPFAVVQRKIPFSKQLMRFYDGAHGVSHSLPGLLYDKVEHVLRIDPDLYRELQLNAAAAAGGGGGLASMQQQQQQQQLLWNVAERSIGPQGHRNVPIEPSGLLSFIAGRVWHADSQQLDVARRGLAAHLVRQANPKMDGRPVNSDPDAYIITSPKAGRCNTLFRLARGSLESFCRAACLCTRGPEMTSVMV
jgi:hypothetical protein